MASVYGIPAGRQFQIVVVAVVVVAVVLAVVVAVVANMKAQSNFLGC